LSAHLVKQTDITTKPVQILKLVKLIVVAIYEIETN
jgi:hypothetical protein